MGIFQRFLNVIAGSLSFRSRVTLSGTLSHRPSTALPFATLPFATLRAFGRAGSGRGVGMRALVPSRYDFLLLSEPSTPHQTLRVDAGQALPSPGACPEPKRGAEGEGFT